MLVILQLTQYIGFFASQLTNSALLLMIHSRSGQTLGTYRHVMSIFSINSLIYSWIEIITQPVFHIVGPLFVVVMDNPIKVSIKLGNFITTLYCASFALCISMLASQFFYRYIAVCKSHLMILIDGKRLFLIFIPCIFAFLAWFSFVWFGMANTIEKQIYLSDALHQYYGLNSSLSSFICTMYYNYNENGEKVWKMNALLPGFGCTLIIASCFTVISFCAFKTYRKMIEVDIHLSEKTRRLNRQLFITLSVQTILPLFLMYIPVGCFLLFPALGVELGPFANITAGTIAVYPSLEPCVAILCITDFRKKLFCQKKKKKQEVSSHTKHAEPNMTI